MSFMMSPGGSALSPRGSALSTSGSALSPGGSALSPRGLTAGSKLSEISNFEHVFCNRSLKMESIKSIGFDMDYTLVLYKPYSFENLVYNGMLQKLVGSGYPKEILSWEFDHSCMIRGLLIDKKRGNILKLDRHHYVKTAYHGFKMLSQEERYELYDVEKVIIYKEPEFAFLDTFFSLAEAFLVSKLVEYKDAMSFRGLTAESSFLANKSYEDFYFDVRKHLDLSHRDDNIKSTISRNPEKYIERDPFLPEILHALKKMGKKLFILTNSLWDYVNPIMSYMLPADSSQNISHWSDYFDFIMTGAQKPQFFSSKNLMYEVDPSNGFLKNLPGDFVLSMSSRGSPFSSHGSPLSSHGLTAGSLPKIFQGGNVQQFHKMLSVTRGSEVLYVGDHIYGDVLRSKKNSGWRTMLLVDELENEMNHKYHPIWGSLMKTGNHNSFFSEQMTHYACLYTSKFSNLRHYSAHKKFEAIPDVLPHESR